MTHNLRCSRCGLPEEEHAYDRCAWGICAGFLAASRDAAEGARRSDLSARDVDARIEAIQSTAPPKPAPDAVREALKPFADIAQFITEAQRDTRPFIFGVDTVIAQRLTIGHLRNARTAYLSAPVPPADGTSDAEIAGTCTNSRCETKPMLRRRHGYDECPSCGKIYDLASNFPRFLGSSSENGSPRVARCVFANDLSDEDHRKIAIALMFLSPSPTVAAEPVAWEYELATVRSVGGTYGAWEGRLSRTRPSVPEGSIRDLRPLYAAPPVRRDREAFYSILSHYIPQQSIDQAWQELREAGLAP